MARQARTLKELNRIGEERVSKTRTLKRTESSNLSNSVQEQYKLDYYGSDNQIKESLSMDNRKIIALEWGDLVKVISQNKWISKNEIVELVWAREKRFPNLSYNRSRKKVEEGLEILLNMGVILKK